MKGKVKISDFIALKNIFLINYIDKYIIIYFWMKFFAFAIVANSILLATA